MLVYYLHWGPWGLKGRIFRLPFPLPPLGETCLLIYLGMFGLPCLMDLFSDFLNRGAGVRNKSTNKHGLTPADAGAKQTASSIAAGRSSPGVSSMRPWRWRTQTWDWCPTERRRSWSLHVLAVSQWGCDVTMPQWGLMMMPGT